MQIKPMPTTVFRNKWNNFLQKLTPNKIQDECQHKRKYSDQMSVGTFESNTSLTDKVRQAFKRKSNHTISQHEDIEEIDTTIYYNEFQSLYLLTIDELNYAEDSKGSSYYSGDLIAAREALDDCTNAFIQLLRYTIDPITREGLQSSISPKLLKLQKRINALPEATETF